MPSKKIALGKVPYFDAADSRVNRWMPQTTRDMLDNRLAEVEEAEEYSSGGVRASNIVGASSSPPKLPLGGGETTYGFYSAEIQLGTPQQSVSVLMDTGSADLAVNLVRRE